MRININLDEELIKKIDEEAKKKYISRSSYIAFAVSQKIQNDKFIESMPELIKTVDKAVEQNKKNNDT